MRSSSTIRLIVIGLVVPVVTVSVPAVGFEGSTTDTEAHDETDERDGAEDPECQGFSLGLDLSRQRKEAPGQEWARGTSGGTESLRKTIESTQDGIVGCRIGDLKEKKKRKTISVGMGDDI